MTVNAKDFLKSVEKQKKTRGTVVMYLDVDLVKRFKAACGDAPYGRVLEKFMTEFADSAENADKKREK